MAVTPVLILHISAGTIGILSGAVAVLVRKGERLHRAFGTVFFAAMLVVSAAGVYLAVFEPSKLNIVAGTFTFYLVTTAWITVRRKEGSVGAFEYGALLIGLGAAAAGVTFAVMAAHSPTGLIDKVPPPPFCVFAGVAAFAVALDLKVIFAGGISGAPRIARHLWRMCAALFIATGSFFLGQQKVMPAVLHGSPILYALALAPLVLMTFWLIRVRFTNAFKNPAESVQPLL